MNGPQVQAVYTPAEAAAFARVSETTLRDAYRNGHLRVHRPLGHRHPKVLHDDLMRWIEGLPPLDSEPAVAATGT